MSIIEIGCCGAYCGTCKELAAGNCKGCKLGYASGGRDASKIRCAVKRCCFRDKGYATCADCAELAACPVIGAFYAHASYKYKKYRQSVEFIREHGYDKFLGFADRWKGPYGALE